MKTETLAASLTAAFGERLGGVTIALNELTAVVPAADLADTMRGHLAPSPADSASR